MVTFMVTVRVSVTLQCHLVTIWVIAPIYRRTHLLIVDRCIAALHLALCDYICNFLGNICTQILHIYQTVGWEVLMRSGKVCNSIGPKFLVHFCRHGIRVRTIPSSVPSTHTFAPSNTNTQLPMHM